MRRGDLNVVPLLQEANTIACGTPVLQRMIPALVASLEYEWISGKEILDNSSIDKVINLVSQIGNLYENSEFVFWLFKARKKHIPVRELFPGYNLNNPMNAVKAVEIWKKLGCPYEQAIALFEGSEDDKRAAITILHKLGASTIIEKLKFKMRSSGIKSIPRGARKTSRSNSANITEREMDILNLLKEGLQNKEIASRLYISAKTVDNHISSILYKLEVNSRIKAVQEAAHLGILK
jgi:DNA-binding CsgD family transcriptional regulator